MDNAQKAIMIGVGLFIAIIIISAVLLITNMGSNLIKKSTTDIGLMTDDLANQIVKDYDAKTITAAEARNLIGKYYSSNEISIIFVNDKTIVAATTTYARVGSKALTLSTGAVIGIAGQTGAVEAYGTIVKTPLSDFDLNTSSFFIASGNTYKTSVIKTSQGGVIGIAMQQV